jgi:hypothetical protein
MSTCMGADIPWIGKLLSADLAFVWTLIQMLDDNVNTE